MNSSASNLTFSSTLLDKIYRSIDEPSTVRTQTTRTKHSKFVSNRCFKDDHDDDHDNDELPAGLYQNLKQNKVCKKPVIRSKAASDCCCCSSSETDSVTAKPNPKLKSKSKSIHTSDENVYMKPEKHEGKSKSTKSKALKMFNDLKKMKQPVSPGGRLTSFLNSLFTTTTTGNSNKPNKVITSDHEHTGVIRHRLETSCSDRKSRSSTSSFSRSSLTDSKSCRGNLSNKINGNSVDRGFKRGFSNENNRISEAARNLLRNYQKKVESELNLKTNVQEEEEEEENDCNKWESDSSSDLFELNNLSPIRIRSEQEELPLYGTTCLHANRVIVSNFVV